jgi:capsid protein
MHAFLDEDEPEQYRGWSPLSTCMKLLKNLEEYYDVELMGAITAANFPVHLETPADSSGVGWCAA